MQAAVDIGGVFDPTPTLDIVGASMSAESGDYWGAGASILGAALPYAGDLAKGPKIAKGIGVIAEAIEGAKSVNGNSKLSKNAQHVYEIINNATNKVEKVGISGGKVTKSGYSYRANNQVNKLNKAGGDSSRIAENISGGSGARQKALDAEKIVTNANKSTLNPRLHKSPKTQ